MTISKIGTKNPAAVVRDITEELSSIKTLVVVGIHKDDSASVWQSEDPPELERAAIILMRFASDVQGSS